MVTLVSRASLWLVLFLACFIAMVMAQDSAFAVHMGISAVAALIAMWFGISRANYDRLGKGPGPPPANTSIYDDDVIRWATIATVFWGMAGFLVGLIIALQLSFPDLNFGPGSTLAGCVRSTPPR
jgi:cytochrome c oxidase cbb3-type subunit 1